MAKKTTKKKPAKKTAAPQADGKVVGQTDCGNFNIVHDPHAGEGYEYKQVPVSR